MDELTVILIYQAYSPFDALLPKVLDDLQKQTLQVSVIISEQPANSLIEKGKLYDKHVDEVKTPYILFSDVDVKMPPMFLEKMVDHIRTKRLDVVFATLKKHYGIRKTCDGIFILKKEAWLDFRQAKDFPRFLSSLGIPTFLPLFIRWCCENKRIGYEIKYPIGLRLAGWIARRHQRHRVTKSQAAVMWEQLKKVPNWIQKQRVLDEDGSNS